MEKKFQKIRPVRTYIGYFAVVWKSCENTIVMTIIVPSGQIDNTHIVFTSDNGFLLGEHRVSDQKDLLYEESICVPLLWRQPCAGSASAASNAPIGPWKPLLPSRWSNLRCPPGLPASLTPASACRQSLGTRGVLSIGPSLFRGSSI